MENPNFPFGSTEAREEFERRVANIGREMRAAAEALPKALTPAIQQNMAALKALSEVKPNPATKATPPAA